MEKINLLKLSNKKFLKHNKKKRKLKLFKFTGYLMICFLLFLTYKFDLFSYFNKNIEKEDKNKTLINKINNYILICRNGTLVNGIQKSSKIPRITVVLILYNSEKTITTSVRSIQNQNFSDFEIIIIDDYSTDKSLDIIKSLHKEDKRIRIIQNKNNRGPLYSRSIGVLNAKGKYIFPLDSDDLFANDNLFDFCYNETEKFNIDILEFSGLMCTKGLLEINKEFPEIPLYLRNKKHNFTITSIELRLFIYKRMKNKRFKLIDAFLWGKSIKSIIYKKALNLLGENIYTQHLCYGEDRIVNFFLFKVANSFKFVNIYGVIYNINKYSITHSQNKTKICHDELLNIISIYNYTKNTKEVEIAVSEIITRWRVSIYPGIKDINNKNNLIILINQMIKSKFINKIDKNILKFIYKKLF